MNVLFGTPYGSHLYGTATPTSDEDFKAIYLPDFRDVLLGTRLATTKRRVDVDGRPVPDGAPMPDNGVETEYVPFQTFCRDFLNGQTYALEIVFATPDDVAPPWMTDLRERFTTANVASMAGFAKKQTFDYIHRGRRLESARAMLRALEALSRLAQDLYIDNPRLDTVVEGVDILSRLQWVTDCELGTSVNYGKTMRTLKLNGREYLETSAISHLYTAVGKMVDSYGDRSSRAAETDVDLKSLGHAVRVYEQAAELLSQGTMTFPRPNPEYLLAVKLGQLPAEDVKVRLLALEDEVEQLQKTSTLLQAKTPELQAEFDDWLLEQLHVLYGLTDRWQDD